MLRVARFGKQFGCGHTPKFLQGAGPAKMLVGELPKPAVLRDKLSQSPGALHRSLRPVTIVPVPYSHARPLCRADDQCSLLLPRPPAFAAGHPGILHIIRHSIKRQTGFYENFVMLSRTKRSRRNPYWKSIIFLSWQQTRLLLLLMGKWR